MIREIKQRRMTNKNKASVGKKEENPQVNLHSHVIDVEMCLMGWKGVKNIIISAVHVEVCQKWDKSADCTCIINKRYNKQNCKVIVLAIQLALCLRKGLYTLLLPLAAEKPLFLSLIGGFEVGKNANAKNMVFFFQNTRRWRPSQVVSQAPPRKVLGILLRKIG